MSPVNPRRRARDLPQGLSASQRVLLGTLLGVAFLAMPLWLPLYYVLELSYVLVLSIACLAINLLLGTTGLLSLGHAAYFGLGAYAGGFLFTLFDLGGLEAYLLAGLASRVARAEDPSRMAPQSARRRKLLEFPTGRRYRSHVMRHFREFPTKGETPSLAIRAGLALLTLVIVVMPALDLAWNEPRAAERQGAPCPLHANPVLVVCPDAVDEGQASEPREVVGPPLRPQLYDASIFIPPKL